MFLSKIRKRPQTFGPVITIQMQHQSHFQKESVENKNLLAIWNANVIFLIFYQFSFMETLQSKLETYHFWSQSVALRNLQRSV